MTQSRILQMHQSLSNFARKLNQNLGENGTDYLGGKSNDLQRWAFHKNSPILILDEATSPDSHNEETIHDSMKN